MEGPSSKAEAVEDGASKWFVRWLIAFSATAGSLFGYDTGVVSGALVTIRDEFSLTDTQVEWFVSLTTLAGAIFALLSAPLNAFFGRKPVIFAGAGICIVGAFTIAFAQQTFWLMIGRTLVGAAVGLTSSTAPMLTSELAPPATRGMIINLNDFSIVAGQLLAGLVNVGFMYVADGWRYAMGLACVPCVLAAASLLMLPESPRWLYLKGRKEAAWRSLAQRRSDSPLDADSERQAKLEFEHMCQSLDDEMRLHTDGTDSAAGGTPTSGTASGGACRMLAALWLEAPLQRAAMVGVMLMGLNQLSGINTVMYYSATIFEEDGGRETAVWLAAACDLAQLGGVLISLLTIDRSGRRSTALRSAAFVFATLVGLALAYAFDADLKVQVILTMAYLVAFGAGLSGVAWVVVAEIYPVRVRSVAVAQAVFVNWIFNYLVSLSFLELVRWVGFGGTFGLYAAVALVGGLLAYRYLPETSGFTLEDIERLFHDPYPANIGEHRGNRENAALLGDNVAVAMEANSSKTRK